MYDDRCPLRKFCLSPTATLFFFFTRQGSTVPESFSSWDAGVLEQLPLYVQESFPFVLTRKSAIHEDVVAEITDNLLHGKGFAASRAALEQAHLKEFHAKELKYYSMLVWRKQNVLLHTEAKDFGSFGDRDGYNGFIPSEHYLSSVWCDVMQKRPVAKLDNLVKGVEGEVRMVAVWTACFLAVVRPVLWIAYDHASAYMCLYRTRRKFCPGACFFL